MPTVTLSSLVTSFSLGLGLFLRSSELFRSLLSLSWQLWMSSECSTAFLAVLISPSNLVIVACRFAIAVSLLNIGFLGDIGRSGGGSEAARTLSTVASILEVDRFILLLRTRGILKSSGNSGDFSFSVEGGVGFLLPESFPWVSERYNEDVLPMALLKGREIICTGLDDLETGEDSKPAPNREFCMNCFDR
ncbi:hypothetical protein EDC01DRAFT_640800 [Geopyxis carbonaria]|nr:hypothetical protein EDC01DRAFT_640800 [Geopyxis carbonaria]